MIPLYVLRCMACQRPWLATYDAMKITEDCPFCGGSSERVIAPATNGGTAAH